MKTIGNRKLIYSSVMSILILIFLSVLKIQGKALNQWDAITIISILIVFPLFNYLSKFTPKKLENILKPINKFLKIIKEDEN